jgi:polyhydroxybutyrate depolymerase
VSTRTCLIGLILLAAPLGCAKAPSDLNSRQAGGLPQKNPGRYVYSIASGGESRTFSLRVPKAYDGRKRLPLVVILHGWTTSGALAEGYTGLADLAEREGFFLAAPDGLGDPKGWNVGFLDLSGRKADDTAFVGHVITKSEVEVGVDPDRIFVAGHSNGAMLAHLVGSQLAKRVAAIGVVAGTLGVPGRESRAPRTIPDPVAPVSVMIIHGRKDETVTFEPELPGLLKGIGAPAAARWWAKRIGAKPEPKRTVAMDGAVIEERWEGGGEGTEVELVILEEGGHAWPGGWTQAGREKATGVNASELLWRFFREHPKRRR